MRFRIRFLLLLTSAIAILLAIIGSDLRHHRTISDAEEDVLDQTVFDIAGYEERCFLPDSLLGIASSEIRADYTHVVYIDLTFNPLSFHTAEELSLLLPCEFLESIRIYNPTISAEMRDVLLGFPRLTRIEMLAHYDPVDSHDCDLRTDTIPGIDIIVE